MNYKATYRDRKTNYLHYGVTYGEPTRNKAGVWTVSFITKHGTDMRVPMQDVTKVTVEILDKGLAHR